jgi:hypothetical protein
MIAVVTLNRYRIGSSKIAARAWSKIYRCAAYVWLIVTVKLKAAVDVLGSETATQYVPGASVTVIWGEEPGVADVVELVRVHAGPLGVPIPNPSGLVVVGDTAVRVTRTVPEFATVNVITLVPPAGDVPENVSVLVVVSDGDVESSLNQLQPVAANASTSANSAPNASRRILTENAIEGLHQECT